MQLFCICISQILITKSLLFACSPIVLKLLLKYFEGVRWRSGRASDSESRGPGFDPHKLHCVVSLCKTHATPYSTG